MILCILIYLCSFISLGCTVNGNPGDGTSKGTCDQGKLCQGDGTCTPSNNMGSYTGTNI